MCLLELNTSALFIPSSYYQLVTLYDCIPLVIGGYVVLCDFPLHIVWPLVVTVSDCIFPHSENLYTYTNDYYSPTIIIVQQIFIFQRLLYTNDYYTPLECISAFFLFCLRDGVLVIFSSTFSSPLLTVLLQHFRFSLFAVKHLGKVVCSRVKLEGGQAGCMASNGHDFATTYNRRWLY